MATTQVRQRLYMGLISEPQVAVLLLRKLYEIIRLRYVRSGRIRTKRPRRPEISSLAIKS